MDHWFELIKEDKASAARAGILRTDHGEIPTPIFMPVGTLGSVKGINQTQLTEDINAKIILGNTYHLYLRPGTDVIEQAGGLHEFIHWNKPMLTDSGGYQIFSLSGQRKIKEEGALFTSHIDGSKHLFTPENNIDVQRKIGADFIMALDECTPYPCDYHYAKKSMQLTHRWLDRGISAFQNSEPLHGYRQCFIPIVQGSTYDDLRVESARAIAGYGTSIVAIGGLSVGEPEDSLYHHTSLVCAQIPPTRGRYLMGVGNPVNLLECISRGIDMFDCVLPSRNARHGLLYTHEGMMNIKNAKWKDNFSPIVPDSSIAALTVHSKAYLHHLIRCKEMLGAQLATLQNLNFFLELVREARKHILENTFSEWKKQKVVQIAKRI